MNRMWRLGCLMQSTAADQSDAATDQFCRAGKVMRVYTSRRQTRASEMIRGIFFQSTTWSLKIILSHFRAPPGASQ